MTEVQKLVPRWILVVSGLFALMELMVGISLYVSPKSVVETVDLNTSGVKYILNMWAIRQFALGVIFAFATIKRSAPMLTLAYVFFLVMFLGDLLVAISQNENTFIVSAIVMCLISAGMLIKLKIN